MIEKMKRSMKNSTNFIQCFATSIALHGLAFYVLYKYPLILYSTAVFQRVAPSPTAVHADALSELKEKDRMLSEVFESFTIEPLKEMQPYDMAAVSKTLPLSPTEENLLALLPEGLELYTVDIEALQDQQTQDVDALLSTEESPQTHFIEEQEPLSTPLEPSDLASLADEVSNEGSPFAPDLSYVDKDDNFFPMQEDEELETALKPSGEKQSAFIDLSQDSHELAAWKAPKEPIWIPLQGSRLLSQASSFDTKEENQEIDLEPSRMIPYCQPRECQIDSEAILEVVCINNWNDFFDTKVSISPSGEESQYLFSITLSPHAELSKERMSQNFYFIIDASSSIDRHKFSLFKRATLKALSALEPTDRFNIFILDKKISRLSQKSVLYSLKSLHMAEEFLEKITQPNFITSADLLESMEQLPDLIEDTPEMHTAILLTNGQSSQGYSSQQTHIKSFKQKNGGKLSVYSAAVGSKNNLVTLDMLCSISGGRLLYSDTNASFPRKVSSLVKSLKTPLAKDITVTALASHPKAGLSLLSTKQTLPAVYGSEPYVIIGKMDRLCDIHLTLQGRHEGEWITVEKQISFQDAVPSQTLKNDWQKAQLSLGYENFLKEAKPKHLKGAKEHLERIHGKVAMQ